MEFLDEYEARPRFLFQSKQTPQQQPDNNTHDSQFSFSSLRSPTLLISLSLALAIFNLAIFYFDLEPLKSILLWISFSLFLGPFAPPSLTGGDIRVGMGPPLKETPNKVVPETNERFSRKSAKPIKKQPEEAVRSDGFSKESNFVERLVVDKAGNESRRLNESLSEKRCDGEEGEWSELDEELLRKLMGKHPVGKPGRWEAIAEGFKGRYKVESVIARAKEMGERKVGDQDSYKKFLKDRKPVDRRVLEEGEVEANQNAEEGRKESVWSSAEDLALLNALKAFPKDVAMRWEKIAASVPGKTKAACVKRVSELKKDFRSSKASSGEAF